MVHSGAGQVDLLIDRKKRGGKVAGAAFRTKGAAAKGQGTVPVGAGAAGLETQPVDFLTKCFL